MQLEAPAHRIEVKMSPPRSLSLPQIALALAVCLQLANGWGRHCEALDAPNELVGQRACTHLMLRLVDCLMDTCDLHLARHEWPKAGQLPVGAVHPAQIREKLHHVAENFSAFVEPVWELLGNKREDSESQQQDRSENGRLQDSDFQEDYGEQLGESTRPMELLAPSRVDERLLSTSGCWREAIKWVRSQLLAMRMRLLISGSGSPTKGRAKGGPLADTLSKFAQLDSHLVDVCTGDSLPALAQEEQRPSNEVSPLEFVTEVIEVLAELACEANERQERRTKRRHHRTKATVNRSPERAAAQLDERPPPTRASELGNNEAGAQHMRAPIQLSEWMATETIKRHYAYLTQIITSFHLLFGDQEDHLSGAIQMIGQVGSSEIERK